MVYKREQKIKKIKISDLNLWTENPRDPIGEHVGDLAIIKRAIKNDKKKWNLPELIKKIKKMGSFYHLNKLPIVVFKDTKYVVYDGNCRIAILKYLQNPNWSNEIKGKLFPSSEPEELKKLIEIDCNVCDEKTALDIIYHDNLANNTWSSLQISYFEHYYLKKNKDSFLILEEQTDLISDNYKELNQRFIRDEILTKNNLEKLGIEIDLKKEGIKSIYKADALKNIFIKLIDKIKDKEITTRNRRNIPSIISEILNGENKSKSFKKINTEYLKSILKDIKSEPNKDTNKKQTKRKTPRTNKKDEILFGEKLSLKKGKVNDLYSILDDLFSRYKNDKRILPIIGMSLRLLMEIAGREAYPDDFKDEDSVFKGFMKKIKDKKILEQTETNSISLDTNFNSEQINKFVSYMGKYAHGIIAYDKTNILNFSKIVGKVLKHFFSKK